jgi:predicted transcriptional regulator
MSASAKKTSISFPGALLEAAEARQKELGYNTFSAYMQALVQQDTRRGGSHVRVPNTKKKNATPDSPTDGKA